VQLEFSDHPYRSNTSFDVDDYFRYAFGISSFKGKPVTVVLSFTPLQGKYIKTQPLHASQQILIDNKKELRVSIEVGVTIELIMTLLSLGNRVKVLQPASLKKTLKDELAQALAQYR
jgi:predicted DNA-binding transcriptional regulator YafY